MSRWPFLVARGRRVGYRVVLAPDFLVRDRQHHLLAEHIGAEPAGPDGRSVVEVPAGGFGPLVATYREEPAAAAELLPGSEPDALRDRHGRPLELLYGVVTAGPHTPVDDHDMALAREAAVAAYRRFLADEEGADVQPSPGFGPEAPPQPRSAQGVRQGPPVPRRRPAPPVRRRGRTWIVTAAALVAVVVAVLVGGRLIAGDGERGREEITVTETPTATPAACADVEAGRMAEDPDRATERHQPPCR